MAVYEHAYAPYEGSLTPSWSRFLILPRYAFRDLFKSKIVTILFAVCFVPPLVMAVIIYLHHNANALAIFELPVDEILPIDNDFFNGFVHIQARFAFLLALIIGPSLVALDLANNGLPLYLSRPFSRVEYVLGKLSVLLILLSSITWIPGLLLYGLQCYLEGATWGWQNAWIAWAIFAGSWAWIVTLSLLTLAISALVKWGIMARASMFGLLIVPTAFAAVINEVFKTHYGDMVSLSAMMWTLWQGLFRLSETDVSPWLAAVFLAVVCLVAVAVLARKVRAYEVVR